MAHQDRQSARGLFKALALLAALFGGGCQAQSRVDNSAGLMQSTSSPASIQQERSDSRRHRSDVAVAAKATSALLAATCSPAFRMLDLPNRIEPDTDIRQVAHSPSLRGLQMLPLMTASASPAFIHRTLPTDRTPQVADSTPPAGDDAINTNATESQPRNAQVDAN